MRRATGPACLALVAGLAVAACGSRDSGQSVEFRVPVSAREVGTATVEDRVVVTGSLRAPELIQLRADSSGILRVARDGSGRRLHEGQRVLAGTLIAEVTGQEVRLAARSDATQKRYREALEDYESKRSLFENGLVAQTDLRQVESVLAEAKVEWERSQLTEDRSRLVTPIAGVVLALARSEQGQPLADGQLVTQGQELARIAPTATLIADVDLLGNDLARVREALPARVRYHAWGDETFSGRLLRLAPSIDPATRTLRAEVGVENPDGRLLPGMFVEVTLIAERREQVCVVPREAVTERGSSKVVFVLSGQIVKRRDVVLGLGDDDVVEIREGVEVGERVVVRGLETLSDGTKVRVTGA